MAELASGDSAMSKAFSQNWKWSHLIAEFCTHDQKERFLKPFLADDTYVIGSGSTEPNAGSDNRYPPEDDAEGGLSAARRAQRRRVDTERRESVHRERQRRQALLREHAHRTPTCPMREGTTVFLVPLGTPGFRIGKVFNKAGWRFYQNAELIFEDARVPHANVVGEVNGGMKVRSGASAEFGDFELAANALGVCDAACESAMRFAKKRAARRQARLRPPARAAQAERDARAHRGAALVRPAHRVGDGPTRAARRQPGARHELLARRSSSA